MNIPKIEAALQKSSRVQHILPKFQAAVKDMETALANKQIWNSDWENVKYWLNEGCDKALDVAAEPKRQAYRESNFLYGNGDPRSEIGYFHQPIYAQGFMNKLKKFQSDPIVASYMEVLAEVAQIGEMMKQIKPFIQKGRKPNMNPKPDPFAGIPRADANQLAKAKAVFEGLCKEMKEGALLQHVEWYTGICQMVPADKAFNTMSDAFLGLFGPVQKDRYGSMRIPEKARIAMDFMEGVNNPPDHPTYPGGYAGEQLVSNWEEKVQQRSKREVEEMFAAFINKQTEKVAAIIKNRGINVQGKVLNYNLECEVHFDLSDKSKFDMRCKIVWHVNQQGTQYFQFPTTFHNAVKADGTKISPASEVNMKKLF